MPEMKAPATAIVPGPTAWHQDPIPDNGNGSAFRDLSDVRLVNAIAEGQEEALAEAYERYGSAVQAFACRLCGPKQADVFTREVFLSLWESPERFNLRSGVLLWPLQAEVHGRCVDALRADSSPVSRVAPLSTDDLEQRMLGRSTSEELSQLLSKLSEIERTAIMYAYFGGYTRRQVAGLINVREEYVARAINSGLSRLRAAIQSARAHDQGSQA